MMPYLIKNWGRWRRGNCNQECRNRGTAAVEQHAAGPGSSASSRSSKKLQEARRRLKGPEKLPPKLPYTRPHEAAALAMTSPGHELTYPADGTPRQPGA